MGAAAMLDFDADAKATDDTPVAFKLKGEILHVHPFDAGLLCALSEAMVAEEDLADVAQLPEGHPEKGQAFQAWAHSVAGIAGALDEMIIAADKRRWRKVRRRLERDELGNVAVKLVEALVNRPTEPPSPSELSPGMNGAASTGDSSSPATTPVT